MIVSGLKRREREKRLTIESRMRAGMVRNPKKGKILRHKQIGQPMRANIELGIKIERMKMVR